MASPKKSKQDFLSPEHGAELSAGLADEYFRQAGITHPRQLADGEEIEPLRQVLKRSLSRRRAGGRIRGIKRLARK